MTRQQAELELERNRVRYNRKMANRMYAIGGFYLACIVIGMIVLVA